MVVLRECGLVLLVAIISSVAVGCDGLRDRVVPPRPVLIAQTGTDGVAGFLDYTQYVYCTIRNDGGHGSVTVTAVIRGDREYQRRQVVPIAAGEERQVQFMFSEVGLFEGMGTRYACSVL